jgi:hypothetical protein
MLVKAKTAGLNALAQAMRYVAITVDPAFAATNATQANTHLVAVYLDAGTVVTGIAVPVGTAGVAVTFAGVGIYDANGNLLASGNGVPANFQSTGWKQVNLTQPFVVPTSGLYYLASGFTATTTLPAVLNANQSATVSTGYPGLPRGIHAQVPAGALPNPAVSQGTFTQLPLLIAY